MTGKEPKVEPATEAAKVPAKDTFRILILDEIKHVEQLKVACKDAGYSVVPAYTIEEAMAFLDGQDSADVIICGAYLKGESMFEFLRSLRSNPIHKDSMFMILALEPRAIGVKIRMNASVEIAGRQLGADAFISMPKFDAVQLITEIKKLLPAVPMLEKQKGKEVNHD
ncbi:hypothetical protein BH10CYA1_BH10CYA1_63270 [soil metagenome]